MPDKRWGDPPAWSCLDDRQRDIIKEWYDGIRKREEEQKSEIYKQCRSAAADPSICVVVWVTCTCSIKGSGSIFQFLLTLIGAIIVFYFGSLGIYDTCLNTESVFARRAILATITVFAFSAIYYIGG